MLKLGPFSLGWANLPWLESKPDIHMKATEGFYGADCSRSS